MEGRGGGYIDVEARSLRYYATVMVGTKVQNKRIRESRSFLYGNFDTFTYVFIEIKKRFLRTHLGILHADTESLLKGKQENFRGTKTYRICPADMRQILFESIVPHVSKQQEKFVGKFVPSVNRKYVRCGFHSDSANSDSEQTG